MHLLYIQENWKTPKWPKYHQTQKIVLFFKKKKKEANPTAKHYKGKLNPPRQTSQQLESVIPEITLT
jgi:hypothetical protein